VTHELHAEDRQAIGETLSLEPTSPARATGEPVAPGARYLLSDVRYLLSAQ
jgi:hypothetical protein